jgi:xanthine dehydrogenase YagS FAD-binding subunit
MNSFTLTQATAADEAVRDLTSHDGAAYLGGGTNLVDLMKYNLERPTHLTSLGLLPLTDITNIPDGGLRLGALATNADTAWHPEVKPATRC